MKIDTLAVLIAVGVTFTALMIWYVSSALQSRFDRSEIANAVSPRVIQRVLLVSRSRFRGQMTKFRYSYSTSFIAFWPILLALVTTGVARWIELTTSVVCVAIAIYGLVLLRRLDPPRQHRIRADGGDGTSSDE